MPENSVVDITDLVIFSYSHQTVNSDKKMYQIRTNKTDTLWKERVYYYVLCNSIS